MRVAKSTHTQIYKPTQPTTNSQQPNKQIPAKAYANQSYCQAKSVYRCVQLSVIFPVSYICKAKGKGNARPHSAISHMRSNFMQWKIWHTTFSKVFSLIFGHASCYHCCASKSQWRNKTLPTTANSNANIYAAPGLT